MPVLVSIAVIVATVLGTDWLVETWLGEARRFWVALAAIPLLVLSGALVKASGINELSRILRNAVIGAGIGAALRKAGWSMPWLRSGLRVFGVETEPERKIPEPPRWSATSEWLVRLGVAGSLVGVGMIWTGAFAG